MGISSPMGGSPIRPPTPQPTGQIQQFPVISAAGNQLVFQNPQLITQQPRPQVFQQQQQQLLLL